MATTTEKIKRAFELMKSIESNEKLLAEARKTHLLHITKPSEFPVLKAFTETFLLGAIKRLELKFDKETAELQAIINEMENGK